MQVKFREMPCFSQNRVSLENPEVQILLYVRVAWDWLWKVSDVSTSLGHNMTTSGFHFLDLVEGTSWT